MAKKVDSVVIYKGMYLYRRSHHLIVNHVMRIHSHSSRRRRLHNRIAKLLCPLHKVCILFISRFSIFLYARKEVSQSCIFEDLDALGLVRNINETRLYCHLVSLKLFLLRLRAGGASFDSNINAIIPIGTKKLVEREPSRGILDCLYARSR